MQKDYSWNPSTCICKNSKYLKSIADDSVIACDQIISVTDIVSKKMKNIAATNVIKNRHSKKSRRLLYFAYSFISDHITIDNCYYLLSF